MARRVFALLLAASTGILGTISTSGTAFAQEEAVGRQGATYGFCMTEEAATLLAERVSVDGNRGYSEVISDRRIACVDTRFSMPRQSPFYRQKLAVTLVEFLWKVRHADGREFAFFWAEDHQGTRAVVWMDVASIERPGA